MGNELSAAGAASATPDPLTPEERAALNQQYDAPPVEATDPGSLYSTEGALRDVYRENFTKLRDAGVLSLAEEAQERKAFAATVVRAGLDYEFGRMLHTKLTNERLAPDQDAAALTARLDAQATATRKRERERWGDKLAETWLTLADKFVRERPALAALIRDSNCSSDPDVVGAIVDHIRHTGYR